MSAALPWLLAIQLVTTLPLVGLIWTIQLVHYPLFSRIGDSGFIEYQHEHMRAIGPLVGPLMAVEALAAIALVFCLPTNPLAISGLALILVIWGSTAILQIPCHRRLCDGFDSTAHRRLVTSNWLRTIAWSGRGGLSVLMIYCWLGTG